MQKGFSEKVLKDMKIYKQRTAYTYLNTHDIKFAVALKELVPSGRVLFVVSEDGKKVHHVAFMPEDGVILNVQGDGKVFSGTGAILNIPQHTTKPYFPTYDDVMREMSNRGIRFEEGENTAIKNFITKAWGILLDIPYVPWAGE